MNNVEDRRHLVKVCPECYLLIFGQEEAASYKAYNCYRHDRAACHFCQREPSKAWGSYEDGFIRCFFTWKEMHMKPELLGACNV